MELEEDELEEEDGAGAELEEATEDGLAAAALDGAGAALEGAGAALDWAGATSF